MIFINTTHKTVWWKVDLGGVYNIYSVNILFKNYDGVGMYHKAQELNISRKTRWSKVDLCGVYIEYRVNKAFR